MTFKQPAPTIQTTTLWDFPSQHYGSGRQGDQSYDGVTPSYIIWNLLQRYTHPGAKVLDPMCGSGTTLDVCHDLKRQGIGFDLSTAGGRKDIKVADARSLPLQGNSVDFVFMDPPYGTHLKYSGKPECIGELSARDGSYFHAMDQVFREMFRVLKDGGFFAVYVQDSFAKGKEFCPIGFELFFAMSKHFHPVDVVCVARHNKSMKRNHWHTSAIEGNYFLRGFNYLLIFRKNVGNKKAFRQFEDAGSLPKTFAQKKKEFEARGEVLTPEKLF
jgi:DNA modification methylase